MYGCVDRIGPCLESLIASEVPFDTRFIFLDNGSPNPADIDALIAPLQARDNRVIFTRSERNLGCAGGWNVVIRHAFADPEAEWVILAGHDIIVHPQTLANLVIRYQRGDVDLTSGVDSPYDLPVPDPVEQEVPGANFSLIMLPRKLIETVGLFDENIWPAYFEDNDYHFRCILAGFGRGIWTWLAPFRHARSSTVVTYPELIQHFAANQNYFVAKWGGLPADVQQKNDALRIACEQSEQRRLLEEGRGWKFFNNYGRAPAPEDIPQLSPESTQESDPFWIISQAVRMLERFQQLPMTKQFNTLMLWQNIGPIDGNNCRAVYYERHQEIVISWEKL